MVIPTTMSSNPLASTLENNMLHYREIEGYKRALVETLNKRGILATDLDLVGNSWVVHVRGEGWRPVKDILSNRTTNVPMPHDYYTNSI